MAGLGHQYNTAHSRSSTHKKEEKKAPPPTPKPLHCTTKAQT